MPLDRAWLNGLRVNRSALERRIATLAAGRALEDEWRAAWLLKAVGCTDLTTLAGDDTPGRVVALCAKARAPIRPDLLDALGLGDAPLRVAAVCVYHSMISTAVTALDGTDIPVAAVSTGFPAGQSPLPTKLEEIAASVAAGAREIDVVISRRHALTGDWPALYDEMAAFRAACGPAHLKAIIATGELGSVTRIAKASTVCMMAGADFVKTSTGMESVNATPAASLVMLRTIRDYALRTGVKIGFKPAGGIGSASQALTFLVLVKEELGDEWLTPTLFRFGASRLLVDIERELASFVAGRRDRIGNGGNGNPGSPR
jgi:deoxyribose-phosphate aldolase